MKKTVFASLLGFAMVVVGCNALHKLTQFHINYSAEFTVPSTLGINVPIDIKTPEITTNSQQEFKNNNTSSDMIESVKLDGMTLTVTSPAGQSLNFLSSLHVYISATGLSEVEVAFKNNVPDSVGSTMKMDLTNVELKEYLKKDKIILRAATQTDKLITQDVKIRIDNTFFVDAKILGL